MVPKLERDLKSMPSVDFKNYIEKWNSKKTAANSKHKALVQEWGNKVYSILRRREEIVADKKHNRQRRENLIKEIRSTLPDAQWKTIEKMFN